MVHFKNTKIIFEFLIIALYLVSAFRIKSKLKEDGESEHVKSTTNYYATPDPDDVSKFESYQVYSPFEDDIEYSCQVLNDSIEVLLSYPTTSYTKITIYTDQTVSRDEEAQYIVLDDNKDLEKIIREEYKKLDGSFSYSKCDIYIFKTSFFIIPDVQTGVESNTYSLFNDYLKLPKQYSEINDLFQIDETITYDRIIMHYYLNPNGDEVAMNDFYADTTNDNGNYRIENAQLEIKTLKICYPDVTDYTEISYQGNLNFYDGISTDITDENLAPYLVPIKTDVNKTWVQSEFDNKNAYFEWELVPNKTQMTVSSLMVLLDTDLTADKSEADEGYKTYINTAIPPPNGVTSIVDYSYFWAFIVSLKNELVYTEVKFNITSFSYLPLQISSTSNKCFINYTDTSNVNITIKGETILDSNLYESEFLKEPSWSNYNNTLYSIEDSELSFEAIKSLLIPSIQIGEGNVLTTDEYSLEQLQKFGINETETMIHKPVISIIFDDDSSFEIFGSIQYSEELESWISCHITLINIDGYVLSYIRFYFPSTQSIYAYNKLFETTSGDVGFQSFNIVDFQLISVNRDFYIKNYKFLEDSTNLAIIEDGNILKDGITVIVETRILSDCQDYKFCKLIKSVGVPNSFNFTGLLQENTQLTTDFDNFTLNNTILVQKNTLTISIDDGNSSLDFECNFKILADPFTYLTYVSKMSFDHDTSSPLKINGTELGIYSEVFGVPIIDLVANSLTGIINENGYLESQNLASSSLIGSDCYTRTDLIISLQESEDNMGDETYDFVVNDPDYNQSFGVDVITDKCVFGNNRLFIFQDPSLTYFIGEYQIENIDQLCTAISINDSELSQGEQIELPYLVHLITFPSKISIKYSYQEAKAIAPLNFQGDMYFLGVPSSGVISINLETNDIYIRLDLYSFSVGGGNLQFITSKDYNSLYGEENQECNFELFDAHISCDEFRSNNTISINITSEDVSNSTLVLDSNILLFDVLFRHKANLTGESLDIAIEGKPFNGVYNSNMSVSIPYVEDMQSEANSTYRIDLIREGNLQKLEGDVNTRLQKWISSIIRSDMSIKGAVEYLTEMKENLKNELNQLFECEYVESCIEVPTIKCAQYALQAVCTETISVCKAMTQKCTEEKFECTRTGEDGNCYEHVNVCTNWKNVCEDDETTNICIAFDEMQIPNQCIQMELSCSKVTVKDFSCIQKQNQLSNQIFQINEELKDLLKWEEIMGELVDSCVCSIKVSDESQLDSLTSCTEKESTLSSYTEKIDIYDIFLLQNSHSAASLIEVVSSDEMIYNTNAFLYGDWTSSKSTDNSSIEVSLLPPNYDESKEYDSNLVSSLTIKHTLDFKSVNQTSKIIFDNLNKIICNEFGINKKISASVQWLLRKYTDIDGSESICPMDNERTFMFQNKIIFYENSQPGVYDTEEFRDYKENPNMIYNSSVNISPDFDNSVNDLQNNSIRSNTTIYEDNGQSINDDIKENGHSLTNNSYQFSDDEQSQNKTYGDINMKSTSTYEDSTDIYSQNYESHENNSERINSLRAKVSNNFS